MPLPAGLARFNRNFSNKLMRPLASHVPGFGVLRHTGRKSGRTYETPLNVWRKGDELVVALTYGSDVDWLKNARESESSEIVMEGRTANVGRPVDLTPSEGLRAVSPSVRLILALLDVEEFVAFHVTPDSNRERELT